MTVKVSDTSVVGPTLATSGLLVHIAWCRPTIQLLFLQGGYGQPGYGQQAAYRQQPAYGQQPYGQPGKVYFNPLTVC